MSVLIVQIPARVRLRPQERAAPAAAAAELPFLVAADDLTPVREGRAAAPLLPKAGTVVAVLGETDVSWHSVVCPKAPAQRMRAALAGLLEDALLDDIDAVHLALPTGAKPGERVWVAVADRAWLSRELAALESAGLHVDRVAPAAWPDEPASGHFHDAPDRADRDAPSALLTWSSAAGVTTVPVAGGFSRAMLPQPLPEGTIFTAAPSVAAPAERWLGRPVEIATPTERLAAAARSSWNLRQFDLAPKSRGTAALRNRWRRFMSPAWRPVRAGVVGLVAVQVLGLNAWAWSQSRQLHLKEAAMVAELRAAHPSVQVIRDAPAQMERETELLRAAAGRAGDTDFETLMQAAASAWPQDRPVQNLSYENGQLTLSTSGWSDGETASFRESLRPAGWQVDIRDGRVVVQPGSAGGRP